MKTTQILLISLISILAFSYCKRDDGVACTMDWQTISINITRNGTPVFLDDYYTKNPVSGEIIRFQNDDPFLDSLGKVNGDYIIITDSEKTWTKGKSIDIRFIGIIDSTTVVDEIYKVTDDVCHIQFVSGKREIIIQ